MKRHPINKRHGARKFNAHTKRTKMINTAPPPMRGGYRL